MSDKVTKSISQTLGIPEEIPQDLANTGNIDFDVESSQLSNQAMLNIAGDQAKEFMTGNIPDDLRDQIEDVSTSKAMRQGLGLGEAGRSLVARDLGLTSVELRNMGFDQAMQVSQARNQSDALRLQAEGQREQLRQSALDSNRNFMLALSDAKANQAQIQLAGTQMIQQNQQFAMSLANDLILNNSRSPIADVQQNIDKLVGSKERQPYLDPTSKYIREIIEEFGG